MTGFSPAMSLGETHAAPVGRGELNERKRTMATLNLTAQHLYDLRTMTGFIGGNELHELFRQLVGEPSPKGDVLVDVADAVALCPALKEAFNYMPLAELRAAVKAAEDAAWAATAG